MHIILFFILITPEGKPTLPNIFIKLLTPYYGPLVERYQLPLSLAWQPAPVKSSHSVLTDNSSPTTAPVQAGAPSRLHSLHSLHSLRSLAQQDRVSSRPPPLLARPRRPELREAPSPHDSDPYTAAESVATVAVIVQHLMTIDSITTGYWPPQHNAE